MRRLEDVSHFFLGRSEPDPRPDSPPVVQSKLTGPRIAVLTSMARGMPGPLVAVGMAALLAKAGKKVVVAEGSSQVFGVTFAVGLHRSHKPEKAAIQKVAGVDLLSQPLSGASLPRYYLDSREYQSLREELRTYDLICVHLEERDVGRVSAEMEVPHEAVLVVPDDDLDAQRKAYRMIKQLAVWNPFVRIALITTGNPLGERRLFRVHEATRHFLQRECLDLGRLSDECSLPSVFLSSAVLDSGWKEVQRHLGPLVDRWWVSGHQPPLAVSAKPSWLG